MLPGTGRCSAPIPGCSFPQILFILKYLVVLISQQLFLRTIELVWIFSSGNSLMQSLCFTSISGSRAFSHQPINHEWDSKPHAHGSGLLLILTAADISWASCAQVINQGWVCYGRELVTISKLAHAPCQVLKEYSCGCTITTSMLVLNPALFATILELSRVSSLVTSAPLCWS